MASLALLAASATHAQNVIRASELKSVTPALAERLLDPPTPPIVEARALWHFGVAQWSGVSVGFAQEAEPTGLSGVCRIEMYLARLRFIEPRERDAHLVVDRTFHYHIYALTTDEPSFDPEELTDGNTACQALGPILVGDDWRGAQVHFNNEDAQPEWIAFAYRAVLAARSGQNFTTTSCPPMVEPRCRDPEAFLRQIDLRELDYLNIAPCRADEARLCVSARLDTPSRSGTTTIVIETNRSATEPPSREIRVPAVEFRAQMHPVA